MSSAWSSPNPARLVRALKGASVFGSPRLVAHRLYRIRVDRIDPVVWFFVSGLLADPERLSAGVDAMIEEELSTRDADPGRERRILSEKVAACARLRAAYQSQQAVGLMTLEEDSDRLKELD